MGERVIALQSRQIDQLVDQIGKPRSLDLHTARETPYGIWVITRTLDCLGQQRQRTHWCLQLVADVRNEVSPYVVDALGLRSVLDQYEQQISWKRSRSDPKVDTSTLASVPERGQLCLPHEPVGANLGPQPVQCR